MTTGKTIALTRWTFVGKVMSLLLNMLFRLVITFLQQYVNRELPDVQAGFRKGRGTGDQIANIRSKRVPENIYFCFIDYAKAFDCVDRNKLWKILKEMGIPDHLTCLLRNSENWTWNNRLVPNRKRNASRLYIVTLLI